MEDSSSAASAPKRSISDMSQAELIELIRKMRVHFANMTEEKAKVDKEREELRAKALTVVQRCKAMEEEKTETAAELAKYKATVDKAVPKLRELKAQLDSKTDECVRLSSLAAAAPSPSVQVVVDALQKAAVDVGGSSGDFEGRLAALTAERDKAKEGVGKALQALKDTRAMLAEEQRLRAEAELAMQSEREMDSKIQAELREVLEALRHESAAQQETIRNLQQREDEADEERAFALNTSLDTLETDREGLQQEINGLREEMLTLQDRSTLDCQALQRQLADKDDECLAMREQLSSRKEGLAAAEASTESKTTGLRQVIADKEALIVGMQSAVDNLVAKITATEARLSESITREESLERQLADVSAKLSARLDDRDQRHATKVAAVHSALEASRVQAASSNEEHAAELAQLQQNYSADAHSSQQKTAALEEQLANLRASKAAESSNYNDLLAEKGTKIKTETDRLQKQIAALQASGSEAAAQLAAQQADKDKQHAAETDKLQKQIAALQAASSDAEQKHVDAVSVMHRELATTGKAHAGEVASLEKKLSTLAAEQAASTGNVTALEALRVAIEERDARLTSMVEQAATQQALARQLEEEVVRVKGLNEALYIKAKTMRLAVQERSAAPREFDILLRVACEDGNWCLVRRDMGRAEADEERFIRADSAAEQAGTANSDSPMPPTPPPALSSASPPRVLEWHREAVVEGWMALQSEGDRGDHVGFVINPGERSEMPPVLQEEHAAGMAKERAELRAQIEALQAEKAQSQQAFDTYRERAKASLVKSAAEQKAAEGAVRSAHDEAQQERALRAKTEALLGEQRGLEARLQALEAELLQEKSRRGAAEATATGLRAVSEQLPVLQGELEAERARREKAEVTPFWL